MTFNTFPDKKKMQHEEVYTQNWIVARSLYTIRHYVAAYAKISDEERE